MIPPEVHAWLVAGGHGQIASAHPVGGGCINNGTRLVTSTGTSFFLKTNAHCPVDMFAREAEGLIALAVPDGPRVPIPHLHGAQFLLLEDLKPAAQSRNYNRDFGRQMAALHQHTSSRFGFEHDNYLGSTPQPNEWTDGGYAFYAQHRLIYQAELAARHGLLSRGEADSVALLAQRLPDLVPEQPASILHGDLWSGNWMSDDQGQPAIIDPATYYGWAEADLAMMVLFGNPGEDFFAAYNEVRPLNASWRERFPLYNLYHILNHLNLFGRGYYSQVLATLQRFVGS